VRNREMGCDLTTYSAMVSYPRTTSARFPAARNSQEHVNKCYSERGFLEARKPNRTFGVRNDDRHEGGSPVGDLDGEISLLVLELVDPNHLPRRAGAARQGKAQHQSNREEQRSSSHGWQRCSHRARVHVSGRGGGVA